MPISTVSYITLNGTDKIGLSDTLDNYSIDEIKSNGYVGAYDPLRYNNYTSKSGITMWDDGGLKDMRSPFTTEQTGTPYPQTRHWTAGSGSYTGSIFSAVVWLQRINQGLPSTVINESNIKDYKLITEMPANKMYYTVPNLDNWDGNATTPISASSWNDVKSFPSSYYAPLWGELKYHSNYGKGGDISVDVEHVYPYMMYEYDGYFYFQLINMDKEYYSFHMTTNVDDAETIPFASSAMTPYDDADGISLGTTYNATFMASGVSDDSMVNFFGENNVPFDWAGPGDSQIWIHGIYNNDDKKYVMYLRHGGNGTWYYHAVFYSMLARKEDSLLYFANGGVHIIADKAYKPIINDGIVTGFTDDLTAPSDLDEWNMGATNHGINPSNPPAPSAPTGDSEIDMPLAYIGGTAGMVDFIKINESGLASADDIADAISRFDITTIGKDLLRNFVAFKCYAVLNIDDSVVRDIKVAGHTLKDENDNALQGEYIGGIKPVDFSVGTIEHLYNDYRDYAPYTRIQMYVPFCGWFDLPSWCMGKNITGTMFTDLYNGTVKAVIYASKTVVAEVGGCCAFDIPFAAESTGMKAGAVISSALSTIAMTGATVAAPNIATGIAAVSSAANFVSAANSNGTTLKGVMGDGSNTNGLLHVYIKTTRPNSPSGKKPIPGAYKHEYGTPCYKELKLTAGDGYTQINDANITGAMTDREKQMIIDGFRHGLIL